jgi:putative membrane protein insertion efficiency factor
MKNTVLAIIRLYKKSNLFGNVLSRIFFMNNNVCRFVPTCSDYTLEAVEKYGAFKGLSLGFKRFLKCNPFFKGGYDPLT